MLAPTRGNARKRKGEAMEAPAGFRIIEVDEDEQEQKIESVGDGGPWPSVY